MRHVEDRRPALRQAADDLLQPVRLGCAQRSRRLVHNDQLRVGAESAGDGRQHLLGVRELVHRHAEVEVGADQRGRSPRPGAHLPPVDEHAEPARLAAAEQHVLRCAQVRCEIEILVDDGDAQFLRVVRPGQVHGAAPPFDRAAVAPFGAGQDLDQSRLAGAVLADERVHLSLGDRHVDLLQRPHAGVALRQRLQRDERGLGHALVTLRRNSPDSATAPIRNRPLIAVCQAGPTPTRISPFASTPRMSTPTRVPGT